MTSPDIASPDFGSGQLTRPQRRIAVTAIGGYFVDGYDLLILSGALLGITPEFHLHAVQLGILTAAAFLGMAFGSAVCGALTDRYGRRVIFFASMVLFVLGSVAFLLVNQPWEIIAIRFVVGVAIGADMPAAAALIAEFIPSARRGTYTALGGVAWMLGSVVAIAVTLLIYATLGPDHWRWAMASGAVAAIVLLFLRHGTPDSPMWLRSKGREEQARAAWRFATGRDETIAVPSLADTAATAAQTALTPLFRRPLLLVLVGMCVYWGCNNLYGSAILLYQPTLITRIVIPSALTSLLFTAGTSVLAVVIGLVVCYQVVERVGRRFLAVAGTSIVVVASFVIWVGFHSSAVVLIAFAAAIGFINGGTSMAFYAWAPELFPTELRGRAVGVVNMVGKLGSVVGTFALPLAFDALGAGAFLLIAAIAAIAAINTAAIAAINTAAIAVLSIETKGQSLDEVQATARRRFGRPADRAAEPRLCGKGDTG